MSWPAAAEPVEPPAEPAVLMVLEVPLLDAGGAVVVLVWAKAVAVIRAVAARPAARCIFSIVSSMYGFRVRWTLGGRTTKRCCRFDADAGKPRFCG
jgi:hypothetical protein